MIRESWTNRTYKLNIKGASKAPLFLYKKPCSILSKRVWKTPGGCLRRIPQDTCHFRLPIKAYTRFLIRKSRAIFILRSVPKVSTSLSTLRLTLFAQGRPFDSLCSLRAGPLTHFVRSGQALRRGSGQGKSFDRLVRPFDAAPFDAAQGKAGQSRAKQGL